MAQKATVLIAGGDPDLRRQTAEQLRTREFRVLTTSGSEKSLSRIEQHVDLVIAVPEGHRRENLDVLQRWHRLRPATPVVQLAQADQVECAVQAMKMGAADCLALPAPTERLLELIERTLTHELASDSKPEPVAAEPVAERPSQPVPGFDALVGRCPAMLEVYEKIQHAALADSTVLVTGESGTGKELVARAIHRHSSRREGPFLATNMAAVPETLIESELFGHVHGAFTGAEKNRVGRFEAASGGTLFIDEVGDLKLTSQAKLLRVLESHLVTPVGSNEDRPVDVRVVAATNRNLQPMLREGHFRGDLFYRINVVAIELPPLRERGDDILLLAEHFVREFCRRTGRPVPHLDEGLLEFFRSHPWPGNVRQLHNCVESMLVLCDRDRLGLANLPERMKQGGRDRNARLKIPSGRKLHDLEKMVILQTLDRHEGNRVHTARSLGISVRTLQRKLQRWGRLTRRSQA